MDLDEIDPQERQRVIDEFRRIGPMLPGKCPSGIELDSPQARQFASAGARDLAEDGLPDGIAARLSEHPSFGNTAHYDEGTFDSETGSQGAALDDAAVRLLARGRRDRIWRNCFGSERPQTIALVLSHLPPERAGERAGAFAPALQVEVVRRLVDLENTDPETLREVERALEARLSQQFAIERRARPGRRPWPKSSRPAMAALPGAFWTTWRRYDPDAGRATWLPATDVRRPRPVRRRRAAGGVSRRRAGSGPSGVAGGSRRHCSTAAAPDVAGGGRESASQLG